MITLYSLRVKKNVFIVSLDCKVRAIGAGQSVALWGAMKKEVVLTVRVDTEIDQAVRAIAEESERTVAWVARKLITEALETRGRIKGQSDKPSTKAKQKKNPPSRRS